MIELVDVSFSYPVRLRSEIRRKLSMGTAGN